MFSVVKKIGMHLSSVNKRYCCTLADPILVVGICFFLNLSQIQYAFPLYKHTGYKKRELSVAREWRLVLG